MVPTERCFAGVCCCLLFDVCCFVCVLKLLSVGCRMLLLFVAWCCLIFDVLFSGRCDAWFACVVRCCFLCADCWRLLCGVTCLSFVRFTGRCVLLRVV